MVRPGDVGDCRGLVSGHLGDRGEPRRAEYPNLSVTEDEIWKDWVERTIAGEWKRLDSLFDWSIYLKIPSFESIVDARWLQEETLRRETGQSQFKTRDEVKSFVALYEPWTLRMAQAKAPWVDQIFEVEAAMSTGGWTTLIARGRALRRQPPAHTAQHQGSR